MPATTEHRHISVMRNDKALRKRKCPICGRKLNKDGFCQVCFICIVPTDVRIVSPGGKGN